MLRKGRMLKFNNGNRDLSDKKSKENLSVTLTVLPVGGGLKANPVTKSKSNHGYSSVIMS